MLLAAFLRQFAGSVQLRNTLVARVNQDLGVSQDPYLRLFEKTEVMTPTVSKRGTEYPE